MTKLSEYNRLYFQKRYYSDKEFRDRRKAHAKIRGKSESQILYRREYNEKNRAYIREKTRLAKVKRRKQCLEHYGGNPPKCACCEESILQFLTIDHINNDGSAHRKAIKGTNLATWLVKNNFPTGFQILCYNCNMSKGRYGVCPHTLAK